MTGYENRRLPDKENQNKTVFWNGTPIKNNLMTLCQQLGTLGIWIRLHYVYPYPHVDDLIPLMAEGKLLPYLDIPLQHASPKILKAMKRPGTIERTLERIKKWREICPQLTLRSTFIVGFPGETEEDFQLLLNFLQDAQLDRVGCFKFSPVEGAPATDMAKPSIGRNQRGTFSPLYASTATNLHRTFKTKNR